MKRLGVYTTVDGNMYDLHYFEEDELAQAVGPLPKRSGSAGVAVELIAESEEDAREKLIEALGPGTF
jgi:hypothetical protein